MENSTNQKQTRRKKINPKRVIAVIKHTKGNKKWTSSILGIDRKTLDSYIKRNAKIAEAHKEAVALMVDGVERSVSFAGEGIPKFKMVKVETEPGVYEDLEIFAGWEVEPDMRAANIILNAYGKDRGYGDQTSEASTGEFTIKVSKTIVSRNVDETE